ncbi:mannonate dehydratase [Roseinatronobacter alkalisoli]|uniref:mannonate dehydratase n=1 Tax=Roseinatronobacter alkalisoli TaxID=3028235 RepID=A0ABT5THD2_9RHOB|nr:mannonate dehydratase [Roseinatronobacter sp. HJB301]MDD7973338.1 mannonate dehydratase [Roseinatronobacter sp. HJB301]
MYLGTQLPARNDDDYRVMKQLGVNNICADPDGDWRQWTRPHLEQFRAKIEGFGLTLDMLQLPMASVPVSQAKCPDILLAGPDRDQQIDAICQLIENCAAAGIPSVKYNFNYIGIPRTPMETGRGGARAEAFRWDLADQHAAGPAGVIDEEDIWQRATYFLSRIVPVAEANGVRLACHPHDPATPPGYMGVTRILGTVEGLKRFVGIHESPVHGLNFCIGTLAEMLEDVSQVPALTRWFGTRGKIMNVHFRNISGGLYSFRETFPDDGDVDMPAVIGALHDCGYRYMVMPDHAPTLAGANERGVAFAFCYGYIAALLQVRDKCPGALCLGPDIGQKEAAPTP